MQDVHLQTGCSACRFTVNLDSDSIAKMNKLCEKLSMNRAQMLRFLFSENRNNMGKFD